MNYLNSLSLIAFTFLLFQCGNKENTSSKSTCNAPLPQAIFAKNSNQIESHSFSLQGHNATENILFSDNSKLTIFQSGCDKISQEFRFQLLPQHETDMSSLGIDRLMFLANLDNKYMSFANWAQAIDGLRKEFERRNEVEVEKGFYVGLDKIDSNEHTTMIIKLFQK